MNKSKSDQVIERRKAELVLFKKWLLGMCRNYSNVDQKELAECLQSAKINRYGNIILDSKNSWASYVSICWLGWLGGRGVK